MDISRDEQTRTGRDAPSAPAPVANDEPETAKHPRAWIVVCKGLGLINIIAESAEELVERLHEARQLSADTFAPALLTPFGVIDNTDDARQTVIWFDPGLVQAVINEYKCPARLASNGPRGLRFPAGQEMSLEEAVAVVTVESEEPDDGE